MLPAEAIIFIQKGIIFTKKVLYWKEQYEDFIDRLGTVKINRISIAIKTCITYRLFWSGWDMIALQERCITVCNANYDTDMFYLSWTLTLFIFYTDWINGKGSFMPLLNNYLALTSAYYNNFNLVKCFYIPLTLYDLPSQLYKHNKDHIMFRILLYFTFILHLLLVKLVVKIWEE
jgi:hypothetical protein